MCNLERFDIDLKALTCEQTALSWELDNHFFQSLEGAQVQEGSLHVSGSIRKAVGFFELLLHTDGTVRIPCDRCLEMMDQNTKRTMISSPLMRTKAFFIWHGSSMSP